MVLAERCNEVTVLGRLRDTGQGVGWAGKDRRKQEVCTRYKDRKGDDKKEEKTDYKHRVPVLFTVGWLRNDRKKGTILSIVHVNKKEKRRKRRQAEYTESITVLLLLDWR